MPDRPVVFVVSDSVGETADFVVRAALSQFRTQQVEIRRFPMAHDRQFIREVVEQARAQPTLIAYTIIVPELHQEMEEQAARWNIPAVDIMGPMLTGLSQILQASPSLQPGLVHRLDEDYFRRVEAVEFAVKYDDGKDPRGFLKADVVLIGVSRSSKTPVSMYLAHRRVKAANLPLVPEVNLPKELFEVPPHKVVGLRINPDKLVQIREERIRTIGLSSGASYASLERIMAEVEHTEGVFKKVGCPVIDVTNKAVEETAVRVLEIINRGAKFSD